MSPVAGLAGVCEIELGDRTASRCCRLCCQC